MLRKLSEKQLRKIINESVRKTLNNIYHLTDSEELIEYMLLRPSKTKLNVDIFIDDGGSYKRHNRQ